MDLPKWLITFVGDIHVSKYPMWVQYKPSQHKLRGDEIQRVLDTVEIGDILLRRHDGYLNTYITPGFWSHAGLVISSSETIHSVGEGVIKENLLDFCRTDSICILRIKDNPRFSVEKSLAEHAVAKAFELLGSDYDFKFKSGNSQYYCTELVDVCYASLFKEFYEKMVGKTILLPASIKNSGLVETILEIRH